MTRANVVELTDDDVITKSTDRFFKAASDRAGPVPAVYDGKYYVVAAIVTDIEVTEAQMDTLETQIEALAGVQKAFVRIGPVRIPVDRMPVGDELYIQLQTSPNIEHPEVVV